jgi:GTP-binding protein
MGKQNVVKSSLVNALTRSDRMIVTEIPGTTVDSVDTLLKRGPQGYRLIDTAGIRKKKRARGSIEKIGVMKTKQNLKRADIALLVLDSQERLSAQDISLADQILRSHKPLLLVFNKWDLIENKKEASIQFRQEIAENFNFLKSSPMVFVSALEKINLKKIFPAIDTLYQKYTKKISTSELNQALSKIVKRYGSFSSSTSRLHLLYITQIGIRPQHFLIFAKKARSIRLSLRRFLENSIKDRFDLQGIPIRLSFRESKRVFLKRKNK